MDGQLNMSEFLGKRMILKEDLEKAEKKATELTAARNRASALIEDARKRYIKEKTRARSKKAAAEKDAILSSSRYDCLKDYEKFEHINEDYGYDCITEAERDRLEALWEEREKIKNQTVDGFYRDNVTEALQEAWVYLQDLWEDEIQKYQLMKKEYEEQ